MSPRRTIEPVMLEQRAASFTKRSIKASAKLRGLLLAMSMIDLTTLEGKDSPEKVRSLCRKAVRPCERDEEELGFRVPGVAAVCVYPALVPVAREALAGSGVRIASVATGFPSGQYPLSVRIADTRAAVAEGADEIDMVINRGAFLAGRYGEVAEEIRETKAACGERHQGTQASRHPAERHQGSEVRHGGSSTSRHPAESKGAVLKVILETGELETYDNIRRASDLAIEAGADFVKTSTGKVQPAATLASTLVLLESVRDEYLRTGRTVGVKPAGGIRAAKQALQYLVMVKETMGGVATQRPAAGSDGATEGNPWLTPEYFRLGASALANDILRQIFRLRAGTYMAAYDFSEA